MSTLRIDTLSNAAGIASVPVNTVINGSAKAWVNFNGTGTVAIRASFNVSSITDNGTGDYTVNFANAMPDANYSVSGSAQRSEVTTRGARIEIKAGSSVRLTSSVRIEATDMSLSLHDMTVVCVNIFR